MSLSTLHPNVVDWQDAFNLDTQGVGREDFWFLSGSTTTASVILASANSISSSYTLADKKSSQLGSVISANLGQMQLGSPPAPGPTLITAATTIALSSSNGTASNSVQVTAATKIGLSPSSGTSSDSLVMVTALVLVAISTSSDIISLGAGRQLALVCRGTSSVMFAMAQYVLVVVTSSRGASYLFFRGQGIPVIPGVPSATSSDSIYLGRIIVAGSFGTSTDSLALRAATYVALVPSRTVSTDVIVMVSGVTIRPGVTNSSSSTNLAYIIAGLIIEAATLSTSDPTQLSAASRLLGLQPAAASRGLLVSIRPPMVVLNASGGATSDYVIITYGASLLSLKPSRAHSHVAIVSGLIIVGEASIYELVPEVDLNSLVGATTTYGPFGYTFDVYGSLVDTANAGYSPPQIIVSKYSQADFGLLAWTGDGGLLQKVQ